MSPINHFSSRDKTVLLFILALALFTRVGSIRISEFRHDEATLSLLAQDMVHQGDIPLTGMNSSVGVPNSPVTVYVMAVPYAIVDNPLFANLFIALLNVAGVAMLWLLAQRYLNRTIAFVGGLSYALNPWAILYSRKIWAQDFHTPFILLAFLLGFYGFIEGKRWAQILCLPVLIAALQIHFAAWALLPLYGYLLLIGYRNINWPSLLISFLIAASTLVPFYLGISQVYDEDPNRIENALNGSKEKRKLSSAALDETFQFAEGFRLKPEHLSSEPQDYLTTDKPLPLPWTLVLGLTLLGLVGTVAVCGFKRGGFVVLWAIIPIAVFSVTWTKIYEHYFIASIPAFALLTGGGTVWLLRGFRRLHIPRLVQSTALAGLGMVFVLQSVYWLDLLHDVDHTYTSSFGTPLHYLLNVRGRIDHEEDVIVISDDYRIRYDQEASIWSSMLYQSARCVRMVGGSGFALLPDHPFSVLIAPDAPENPVQNLYQTDQPVTFSLRANEGAYTLYSFKEGPDRFGPPMTAIPPVRFDNGAQLVGYALDPNWMYLEWRLPRSAHPDTDYQYSGQFLDENGEKIGQRDASFLPSRYWCQGDRLITWIDIALPDSTVTLRASMYHLDEVTGGWTKSFVVNEQGQQTAAWIDIPLGDFYGD